MLNSKKTLIAIGLLFSLYACKKELNTAPTAHNFKKLALDDLSSLAPGLISNVIVQPDTNFAPDTISGADTTFKVGVLDTGVTYYSDRNYKITALSDSLRHMQMIKMVNDDKHSVSDSYLSFDLAEQSTVYVAFDPRATTLPEWLQGWQKLPDTVGVSDPKVSYFSLYSKVYPAGPVILGAATAYAAENVQNQYFVAAKPKPVDLFAAASNPAFMLGVNGHSLGVLAYKSVSNYTQISLLKKMGMNCYRQDIGFNSDGTISSLNSFKALYAATSANGVTILCMIYPKTFNPSYSESTSYNNGKILGTNVARKNSGYFKYYELGNEFDNLCITSGNGDIAANYNMTKLRVIAAYLKGMDDGIKSVQPGAQTMIDASWLHTYFLQYMINYGNRFNIIASHWYSDMEATATRIKIPDISVKLASIFSKPIWFTETGQRPDRVANIEQVQSNFLTSFVIKVKKNPRVGSVLCYELFDEPQKSFDEESYGLMKWISPYSQYTMKKAAQTFSNNRY